MTMLTLLWTVPALPLAGFLVLVCAGSRLSRRGIACVGAGSVGLAAGVTGLIAYRFLTAPPPAHAFTQVLWTWFDVAGFTPQIALYLDALALVMMTVVTGVGFLIHVYSAEYMIDDDAYARFFAYMNLFVSSMLILVLADNLLLLYLGWEGVGLCSYLLIGFWYTNPANGRAALKAFLVTRVGDTAMAIGLFLIVTQLGTLHIQSLMQRAEVVWPAGSGMAIAAAALLLGGALGKSGQLPLQVWLPDAMAGPTPVSALIHAATMVTAGVYLIARTHVLFELAPVVRFAVAVIGAATLLIAGFSALSQRDIKRVLAYSTISQIGYMFLALGVGAWSAAIFHLFTHAFFKALLFMAAGAVILALHHEQDMFNMGGLRKKLPLVFWTFLIGSMSLASLPVVTAGFFSKDLILFDVWCSPEGGKVLWLAGWVGAFLTALYTFRMVFLTFFGESKAHEVTPRTAKCLTVPLVALAVCSTIAGWLELPRTLGDKPIFTHFLSTAFPEAAEGHASIGAELALQVLAVCAVFAGLGLAYVLFLRDPARVQNWLSRPLGAALQRLSFSGCGFDALYNRVFVQPFVALARMNKDDVIDSAYTFVADLNLSAHRALSFTQTGRLRWYMMGIAIGAALTIAMAIFL
jgi:NADH-quinone oxidoreductase subunit L